MAWCWTEADGLPPMATGGGKSSTWTILSEAHDEDEVEAIEECSIVFEV